MDLLRANAQDEAEEQVGTRPVLSYDPLDPLRSTFLVPKGRRSYQHQFANVYYLRLAKLKSKVLESAKRKWTGEKGGIKGPDGSRQKPQLVKRVLDVTPGRFCYIVGTVYCEMRLKPNVLEDLAREVHRFSSMSTTRLMIRCSTTSPRPRS